MDQISETVTLDASANVRKTADGYLVAQPRVGRTGIQVYKGSEVGHADKVTVRVLRPEAEVFHKDAISSLAHRPITINHPSEGVNAKNWRDVAVGFTDGEIVRDGEFIRVPMAIMDQTAINAIEAGKNQLSLGYTAILDWTPGKTQDGQEYDAIQTDIRINHLAIVGAARGGPSLRIGDADMNTRTIVVDNLAVEMTDNAARVVERFMADMKAKLETSTADAASLRTAAAAAAAKAVTDADTLKASHTTIIQARDAEIATLKTQLADAVMTPAKLDAAVRSRSETVAKARTILDSVVVDGKSEPDIMRQVVNHKLGAVAKDWTDAQVSASFGTLTAGATVSQDQLARALGAPAARMDTLDAAYQDRDKRLTEAWRNTPGQVAKQ